MSLWSFQTLQINHPLEKPMVISEAQTGDTAKHNLDQIFDEETLAKL